MHLAINNNSNNNNYYYNYNYDYYYSNPIYIVSNIKYMFCVFGIALCLYNIRNQLSSG